MLDTEVGQHRRPLETPEHNEQHWHFASAWQACVAGVLGIDETCTALVDAFTPKELFDLFTTIDPYFAALHGGFTNEQLGRALDLWRRMVGALEAGGLDIRKACKKAAKGLDERLPAYIGFALYLYFKKREQRIPKKFDPILQEEMYNDTWYWLLREPVMSLPLDRREACVLAAADSVCFQRRSLARSSRSVCSP